MSNNRWRTGLLRERLGPLKIDQVVFFRKVARDLAAQPCWWIRPQGVDHYWMVAESYGGHELRFLVRTTFVQRGPDRGQPLLSPKEHTEALNLGLRKFVSSRPPGSLPVNPGVSNDKSHIRSQVRV